MHTFWVLLFCKYFFSKQVHRKIFQCESNLNFSNLKENFCHCSCLYCVPGHKGTILLQWNMVYIKPDKIMAILRYLLLGKVLLWIRTESSWKSQVKKFMTEKYTYLSCYFHKSQIRISDTPGHVYQQTEYQKLQKQ